MKRVKVTPRDNADEQARRSGVFMVERTLSNGLVHRTWDENSAYLISKEEVKEIVKTVQKTVEMAREAVDFILDGEWGTLGATPQAFNFIRDSFDERQPELFTRYDFAYTADQELKLVNIDADSPRYFIETAHAQRAWLHDMFANKIRNNTVTQLNSLPEMSRAAFKKLKENSKNKNLHIFSGGEDRGEDWLTSAYIKGLVQEAGWKPQAARMKGLLWDSKTNSWTDENKYPVTSFYKHYPWELLLSSATSKDVIRNWRKFENMLEPAWKYAMSTRAMLPAMYQLYPNAPMLSPAKTDNHFGLSPDYSTAPLLPSSSRNEMGRLKGRDFTSWGENMKDFSSQETLIHRKIEVPKRYRDASGGYRFTYLSAFTVGGHLAGIGIRESRLPLLGSHTTFKPHVVML